VKDSNLKEKISSKVKDIAVSSKELAYNGYEKAKKLGHKAKEKTKETYH